MKIDTGTNIRNYYYRNLLNLLIIILIADIGASLIFFNIKIFGDLMDVVISSILLYFLLTYYGFYTYIFSPHKFIELFKNRIVNTQVDFYELPKSVKLDFYFISNIKLIIEIIINFNNALFFLLSIVHWYRMSMKSWAMPVTCGILYFIVFMFLYSLSYKTFTRNKLGISQYKELQEYKREIYEKYIKIYKESI